MRIARWQGFRVGIRYVGQLGDDTVANIDPTADFDFPLPLQNKRLPHPNVWQRLFDLLFSWLEEGDKVAREAEVNARRAEIEARKATPITTSIAEVSPPPYTELAESTRELIIGKGRVVGLCELRIEDPSMGKKENRRLPHPREWQVSFG